MKAIVLGSSGFIGSHLTLSLSNRHYEVLGIDIESKNPEKGPNFKKCSLLDSDSLAKLFNKFRPEFVIHLAARTDLKGKTLQEYAANSDGVHNLVSVIDSTPSVKRCIFTSSQLVCNVGYVPKNSTDFKPTTLYGKSKVLTEKIVRECNGGGVEWCITRPTTIWGPGMSPHYQQLFRMIDAGRYFHVGNSPLYKSYGYVGNTVYQYLKLLEAPSQAIHGKVFYLADYEPLSLRRWIDGFQRELGAPPIKTVPNALAQLLAKIGDAVNALGYKSFPFNSFRLNNILTEYQFDLTNIEEITGPLPFNMELGIAETVKWLKEENIVTH